jgi:hypothetical protein
MSLALDDARRGSDPLPSRLRELTDVVAQQNATIAALRIERDTVRYEHEAAQAEIEKLRLLIRQLQRGQFGRRSAIVWTSARDRSFSPATPVLRRVSCGPQRAPTC